jgi:hypothetical protein
MNVDKITARRVLEPPTEKTEELLARIAELEAKLEKRQTISCKVSEKGAMSVYGLGRFPVTLYRQQWERLLGAKNELLAYIAAHLGELSVKD